jgi:hypothetical protein
VDLTRMKAVSIAPSLSAYVETVRDSAAEGSNPGPLTKVPLFELANENGRPGPPRTAAAILGT